MTMSSYNQWEALLNSMDHDSLGASNHMEWGWDPLESTTDVSVSDDTFKVVIHPNTSKGTGAVRGDMPFMPGHIYYWEIKMEGSPMATDMIVGVGTKDFDLESSENEYTSLIGSDEKSWGYSFRGVKHHGGESLIYGQSYFRGDALIGVRLDMCRGTLEFFRNRIPLGVAFEKLNNKNPLYPMVCSTACRTNFTINYCHSLPVNLQLYCLQALDSKKTSLIPFGISKMLMDSWWIPKSYSS
ncbi:PREDICTED: SPRY domain-containing SOCS box protein 3-like isoform X1 [Diuraphis noxia]|uniref:SPRY domain-containing SOCS box protein 3-like isoform X1 n=2 Tax=Diuraphis noxia TaxID=143948 RepID=UPI0007638AB6|nr:PREDICTED: SPRY domain-containing SOCS box protein 3-like isoform X1 [Diuraphis noxia]